MTDKSQQLHVEIASSDILDLVGRVLSQPHEPILEAYCRDLVLSVRGNVSLSELEGLARAELRRALVEMRSGLDDVVSMLDRME